MSNPERKFEYFQKSKIPGTNVIVCAPPKMYPQDRDWTCSIACIRTMLSAIKESVEPEDFYIKTYGFKPGPHYSKEIKETGIFNQYDAKYGCDNPDVTFEDILELLKRGYCIMLESMINYAHWTVLLGYFPIYPCDDIENSHILMYDPYYNRVFLMCTDEFIGMWIDGDHNVTRDYIAVSNTN